MIGPKDIELAHLYHQLLVRKSFSGEHIRCLTLLGSVFYADTYFVVMALWGTGVFFRCTDDSGRLKYTRACFSCVSKDSLCVVYDTFRPSVHCW